MEIHPSKARVPRAVPERKRHPRLRRPDGGLRDAGLGLREAAGPRPGLPPGIGRGRREPVPLQLHRLPPAEGLRLRSRDDRDPASRAARPHRCPRPPIPLTLVEDEIAGYRPVKLPGHAPLHRRRRGYIGYEYVDADRAHRAGRARATSWGSPSSTSCSRTRSLIFDRAKQTLRLCVNAHVAEAPPGPRGRLRRRRGGAGELFDILRQPRALAPAPLIERRPGRRCPPGNFTRAGLREAGRGGEGIHPGRRHHPGRALAAVHPPLHQDPARPLPGAAVGQPVALHVHPRHRATSRWSGPRRRCTSA